MFRYYNIYFIIEYTCLGCNYLQARGLAVYWGRMMLISHNMCWYSGKPKQFLSKLIAPISPLMAITLENIDVH